MLSVVSVAHPGGMEGSMIVPSITCPEIPGRTKLFEERGVQVRGLGIRFHLVIFGSALI